jgi:hypothetical protein
MQNGFLFSSRSRRKKPFSIWWSIAWVLTLLVTGHGGTPRALSRRRPVEKKELRWLDRDWTVKIKTKDTPSFNLAALLKINGPDWILDSSTLDHPFYFLRQGKHTLSCSNLMRPSRVEPPTLNKGSVDPWAEHRGPGPPVYGPIRRNFP